MRLKRSKFEQNPSLERAQKTLSSFITQYGIFLFLTCLSALDLWHNVGGTPLFALIAVFYLSLFYPERFVLLDVFILGLFFDVALGQSLGYYSALFLSLRIILQSLRRYAFSHSYLMGWIGFIIFCGVSYFLEMIILSFYTVHPRFSQMALGYGIVIMFYPILSSIIRLFVAR